MKSEITSLEVSNTWDLVDLPPNRKLIWSHWIFRIKLKAEGSLERYKARLVALGNNQVQELDYTETFTLVVKMSTVRLILDISAKKNYEIHQMYVHYAFLHSDLDEEIYMKPPPGISCEGDNVILKSQFMDSNSLLVVGF